MGRRHLISESKLPTGMSRTDDLENYLVKKILEKTTCQTYKKENVYCLFTSE